MNKEKDHVEAELIEPPQQTLTKIKPQALAKMTSADMMIMRAIESGMPTESLRELMAMKIEWDHEEARKEAAIAMTLFQGNCPEIDKTSKVKYDGKNGAAGVDYNYAKLEQLTRTIKPTAKKNGFSWRFTNDQDDVKGIVTIGCIIMHRSGYEFPEVKVIFPYDKSGNKDQLKAARSAMKYGQRASLELAMGLSTKECDDDGNAAAPLGGATDDNAEFAETISDEENAKILELLEETQLPLEQFLGYFHVMQTIDLNKKQFEVGVKKLLMRKQIQVEGGAK